MTFSPYAETPVRSLIQVTGDVLVVLWCVIWWSVAGDVRDGISSLRGAGRRAEEAGTGLESRLGAAGDAVGGLPLAGDSLSTPLREAATSAESLAEAGRSAQSAIGTTAEVVHATLLVVLVGVVAAWWLLRRVRWCRTAVAARRLRESQVGLAVLGVRAAATAPLGSLPELLGQGPGAGLDSATLVRLGTMELRRLGLRPTSFH